MHAFAALHTITFESLDVGRSFSHIRHVFRGYVYKFVSEGHLIEVKVKVTAAKKVENCYSHYVKLR